MVSRDSEIARWAYQYAGCRSDAIAGALPGLGVVLRRLVGDRNVCFWSRPVEIWTHPTLGPIAHLPFEHSDYIVAWAIAEASSILMAPRVPHTELDIYRAAEYIQFPDVALCRDVARAMVPAARTRVRLARGGMRRQWAGPFLRLVSRRG